MSRLSVSSHQPRTPAGLLQVADPACQDADTRAIRAFNEALYRDARVDISLIPIADGLTLAMKRV